jgi:hypothetical protein
MENNACVGSVRLSRGEAPGVSSFVTFAGCSCSWVTTSRVPSRLMETPATVHSSAQGGEGREFKSTTPLAPWGRGASGERVPGSLWRSLILLFGLFFAAIPSFAQGGPPFYTNDPGTPGNLNWEINLGYMPFFYTGQSVSHTPDVDINFGVGDRIQLTYENAWLRVQNPSSVAKFGLGQSNPGVKWRFYDAGEDKLSISIFPQGFFNNPNDAVHRGITSASDTFLMPIEFSKKFGPVGVDYEIGYDFVHKGPDGWIRGLVLGHDLTKKLEIDLELYSQGTFHPSAIQPTIDFGARYKLHSPVIILLMAGRSLEPTRPSQSYFIGYFGIQLLLPPRSYNRD